MTLPRVRFTIGHMMMCIALAATLAAFEKKLAREPAAIFQFFNSAIAIAIVCFVLIYRFNGKIKP